MKMLSRNMIAAVLVISTVTIGEAQVQSADDAKFAVHLDLKAFRKTELGERMIHAIKKIAAEEISDENGEQAIEQIEETLGFDPLEEVQSLTVVGTDFDSPERNLRMVLKMRETTGNLEGLLLALPGYDSSEFGDHTIHTAAPDGEMRVYGAIHESDSKDKQIVVSTKRADVENMLRMMLES